MKKYLENAIIEINDKAYQSLIVFLSPLLNFLSGINIDIYSPSMPSISSYFNVSVTVTKNTISITLLGWTIGALLFGVLIDSIGRKKILVFGLFFYVIASLFASWSQSIEQLMIARFIQGLTIATITIGCRALIIDNMSGNRYTIAILYTSIGYALGPIIGPFFGSILQRYFGWQANFIVLAALGTILLLVLVFFIKESIPQRHSLILKEIRARSITILKHKQFMAGTVISGLKQIQIMLYPTIGPFIVINILQQSVLVYGNTALVIGGSYLMGAVISRVLLKYFSSKHVCYVGYVLLLVGLLFSYLFSMFCQISLFTVMFPLMLFCISAGLIFANVMGTNLKQFPNSVGISMAIQASLFLLIASVGIFMISHIHIVNLGQLSIIFSVLVLLEVFLFFMSYRKIFD